MYVKCLKTKIIEEYIAPIWFRIKMIFTAYPKLYWCNIKIELANLFICTKVYVYVQA